MIVRLKILIILFLSFTTNSFSQEIKGKITNQQGEPIKYATIYIEELQTGTSANQNGDYAIKVSSGKYTISFRSLGFSPTVKKVEVGTQNILLNIELNLQSYILQGVTVRADNEDPAYSIMRKAIARAPGFINQSKSYTSEVYIKGALKFNKIPKIIQKQMEVNGERPKEGTTYVNESINKIRFKAPDIYEQEVISVNNTFPISDDDVPVMGLMSGSIYKSEDDFYISPFAPNAFAHYRYSYEGLLQDGSWFISKIRVIPKRKSKLLFDGYLYIVEDIWCLYSYELKLNPSFVELEMKQHYAPVKGNNYFPVNLFVKAKIKAMGVKADANYTTTIKYDSVILNPQFARGNIKKQIASIDSIIGKDKVKNKKVAEVNKKIDNLLSTNELSNREMVQLQKLMSKKASLQNKDPENPLEIKSTYHQIVKKEALVRDSLYWDSVRPVPASIDEKISYRKVLEKEKKEDTTTMFKKVVNLALFGNYEWERKKKIYLHYPGIIDIENFGFNPVDGFRVKQRLKLLWKVDSLHKIRVDGRLGYAINRGSFFGKSKLAYHYAPLNRGQFVLHGGYLNRDFNIYSGTYRNINAVYNLLAKQNYIQQYHDTYFEIRNYYEVTNGLLSKIELGWHKADSVGNITDFSFLYPDEKYKDNIPENKELKNENITSGKIFTPSIQLSFTPKQHYQIIKGIKHVRHSKWPTFVAKYKTAIKIDSSYSKFHQIEFGIKQNIDIYSVSNIRYTINGGAFFDSERQHFSTFKHFKTFEEPFTLSRSFKEGFYLLNNYEYSTAAKYLEGHVKYTSDFLILKHLPIISNQLWKENLFLNVLFVENHYPYYEVGYSLSQIFFGGELGVFTGFKGTNFHMIGVRGVFVF